MNDKYSSHPNYPGPLPERWLKCPRKASHLVNNKFLAFKTPLDERFDGMVMPEYRFPPQMIFDSFKQKKICFGLWIDLTNSKRYYSKAIITNQHCAYVKLSCRGHGEAPDENQVKAFIEIVKTFQEKDPISGIAVHCTHGFNRTGFLIASYLIEKCDYAVDAAVKAFADARPPGIYKDYYLEELFRRYDKHNDVLISVPDLPDWCYEDEENKSDNYKKRPPSPQVDECPQELKRGKFMEGVPSVAVVDDEKITKNVQDSVLKCCRTRRDRKLFVGSQPVSLDRDNIKLLEEKPYRVSWKADGTRYLMLILEENEIYFLDRDNCVYRAYGFRFPKRNNLEQHLTETLLDGEMVIDIFGENKRARYLAYDIISLNGYYVGDEYFYPNRHNLIDSDIIAPRHEAMRRGIIQQGKESFSIRRKDFWDVTLSANLLGEKFARTLSHEPDGLIFQPSRLPYQFGTFPQLLKWKPPHLNSVDFRLKIENKNAGVEGMIQEKVANLYVGQCDKPKGFMKFKMKLKEYDNKIVECNYANNEWVILRERTDKSFPNALSTANAVWKSIMYPVTKELLLDYIAQHRYREKDSDMMPPPAKIPRISNS